MANRACVQRLQKEFRSLCKDPVSHVVARPSPSDILEWHYVLEGSPGTPFEGGFYHGKLKFPQEYPFRPPSIYMITPSGRFAPNKRICMSMSDFHPETWNPMWSVASILTGLLSFMMDSAPTNGSVSSTVEEKKRLALESLACNCRSPTFRKMFPEYIERLSEQQKAEEAAAAEDAEEQGAGEGNVGARTGVARTGDHSKQGTPKEKQKVGEGGQGVHLPLWLTAVLVALCGMIMALPFLTLDLKS